MINFPIVYQSRYIGLISLGKAWYRETSEGESGGMVGRGEGRGSGVIFPTTYLIIVQAKVNFVQP